MAGKLIVLEGTDGSGKSTQFRLLCERLEREGIPFRRLVFPQYQEPSSALLRMYLNGEFGSHPSDVNAYAASVFFAVDRYASWKKVWGAYYQNGGLEIGGDGFTKVIDNLLVAGEAVGGIHGRNRLMGNSLLDIIVFGRNAGKAAAAKAKNVELGNMNLDHIEAYAEELKEAGLDTGDVSPLLLPKYARHER